MTKLVLFYLFNYLALSQTQDYLNHQYFKFIPAVEEQNPITTYAENYANPTIHIPLR